MQMERTMNSDSPELLPEAAQQENSQAGKPLFWLTGLLLGDCIAAFHTDG